MDETNVQNKLELEKVHKKSNYAWAVASSGFLSQIICVWCLAIFGTCLVYIAQDFGVAPPSLSIGISVFGLLYAGCSFIWGTMADKIGLRITITIAGIGVGVFLIICGFVASSPIMAIVLYACAGVFVSGCGSAVLPKIVSTWFAPNMRGKGIAVITLGGSLAGVLGGIVMPQLILAGGWRLCFEGIGAIIVVLGIVMFLVMRDSPAKIGTVPLGNKGMPKPIEKKVVTPEEKAEDNKRRLLVLKQPITWMYGAILIFWQLGLMSHTAFNTAAVQNVGFDIVVAGLVGTSCTVGMTIGQIIFPTLSDKLGRKGVLVVIMALAGVMAIVYFFVLTSGTTNDMFLYLTYGVFGLFFSATPLHNTLMGECYPDDLRGTGPGVISTIALVGRFGGPIACGAFIGMMADQSAYYAVFMGACFIISAFLALLWAPKTGGKYGDPEAHEELV
ncbi:MFS transporter [Adlercreutzia sp. ZJ154]|uniref:MFS transporter n=1 Tax=Adlercreutzia sp. ZJ154 TaxID=2709790 RepID=UPI0013E9ACAC|nr:MFS transporter [Adlercreutzia sp. ZJ154]